MRVYYLYLASSICVMAGLLSGCRNTKNDYSASVGGYAGPGRQIMMQHHCGECHTIPGMSGARGVVGPPLIEFSRRTMIAGQLPNEPDDLVRWIMSPRSVKPKTDMPNLGLNEQQARDVAAYLYTLR